MYSDNDMLSFLMGCTCTYMYICELTIIIYFLLFLSSLQSPSLLVRKMEDLEKNEQRIKEREHLIEKKLVTATHTLDRDVSNDTSL